MARINWFDGWPFVSKEENEQNKRAYENRVLPAGEGQKAAALSVLAGFVRPGVPREELLFAYLSVRDAMTRLADVDITDEQALAAILPSAPVNEGERRAIVALARLEGRAPSLESYPTAADVQARLQHESAN